LMLGIEPKLTAAQIEGIIIRTAVRSPARASNGRTIPDLGALIQKPV